MENKLFLDKKKKREEELKDWMIDGRVTKQFFFVMNLTAQLNALNKELRGRDKLITEMSDTIEAFKFKL